MSFFTTLNRNVFRRTSTFFLVGAVGTFFFERTFDVLTTSLYESLNKGKLWKDIEHKYKQEE